MKAIGIDIGTTAISGILLDARDGTVVRSVTKNSEAFLPTDHSYERIQDTERIIAIATQILEGLITEDTAVIGITGQMHGILYYDREGNAVSPLYTWQDGRGNLPYRKGKTYSEYLGIPSGYGLVTDYFNEKNGLRPSEAVGFTTIFDYFGMKLTGRTSPLMHVSGAASLGGFDLSANRASERIVGEVVAESALIGSYRGIPVSVALGDNQASVYGALADEGDLLLNVGTGSQISLISPIPVYGENIETRPYVGGSYLVVGAALCGGRAYAMLERLCAEIVYHATGKRESAYGLLSSLPEGEAGGLFADTRFCGTRRDPSLTGGILGITQENLTLANLKAAFLGGIVHELFGMFSEMERPFGALVGSGNGLRKNPSLVAEAERRFGKAMKIPVHLEEAAYGAALFGLSATDLFDDPADVKKIIRYQSIKEERNENQSTHLF